MKKIIFILVVVVCAAMSMTAYAQGEPMRGGAPMDKSASAVSDEQSKTITGGVPMAKSTQIISLGQSEPVRGGAPMAKSAPTVSEGQSKTITGGAPMTKSTQIINVGQSEPVRGGAPMDMSASIVGAEQSAPARGGAPMDKSASIVGAEQGAPARGGVPMDTPRPVVEEDNISEQDVILATLTSSAMDDNILWAKNLKRSDVSRIEAVRMPAMENERYKDFDETDFNRIVEIMNNAEGKRINNPEEINGSCITFYITTTDGARHTFSNNGNTYLVIDGVSFDAGYDWLSTWGYEVLDNKVPENFEYAPVRGGVPMVMPTPVRDGVPMVMPTPVRSDVPMVMPTPVIEEKNISEQNTLPESQITPPRLADGKAGNGTIDAPDKYWEMNGYPDNISFAFEAGGEILGDGTLVAYWEIGIINADEASRQEILDLLSPNCLVTFRDCQYSYNQRKAAYNEIYASRNDIVRDVLMVRNSQDVLVEIADGYEKEYAKKYIEQYGAFVGVTNDIAATNNAEAGFGGLEIAGNAKNGLEIGGNIKNGLEIDGNTKNGFNLWVLIFGGVLILGIAAILFTNRTRFVPAMQTTNGNVVTGNPPVSRKQTIAAIRNSAITPSDNVYNSIMEKIEKAQK